MIPIGILVLAILGAYLGAIDAAFSALIRLSLRLLAERSDRVSALGEYLEDPLLLFIPLRFLMGVVTVTATALFAKGISVEGAHNVTLVILAGAGFVVLCELLLPIAFVVRGPERVLDWLLPSFVPVARTLGPFSQWIARSVANAKPEQLVPPLAAAEDPVQSVHTPAEEAAAEVTVDGEDRRLLQSIVDFGDTLVREVMTPRPDIVAIPESASVGDLRALFREQEYSRFPVFKGSLDNIAGFVFIKDLVLLGTADDSRPIAPLVRPASVVPETKLVPDLLKQFQRQQVQCAIVVDEYGGTAGLVTIEDLLEEIVGEIRDEYDVESETIVDEGNGRFVFSGKVDIDEVADRLDVDIEREGFETVGGYLMSHLGRVPVVGERFDVDGVLVEVLDAERRRVNKVRMTRIVNAPREEEPTPS
jgi:CBS domain containing-hemolysin-like protein